MSKGIQFADFTSTDFIDWELETYVSYLHTWFMAAEDTMFFMQAPYVYVFLENDDAISDNGTESLYLQGAWDWDIAGKRWSRAQQVYKYRAGNLVAVSRTKVRGRGRVLQLRFTNADFVTDNGVIVTDGGEPVTTSSTTKGFRLLGWGLPISKSDNP